MMVKSPEGIRLDGRMPLNIMDSIMEVGNANVPNREMVQNATHCQCHVAMLSR